MKKKGSMLVVGMLSLSLLLSGCGSEKPIATATQTATKAPEVALSVDPSVPQKVKITMENGKSFVIETAPEYAPATVKNFLELVESGFYDGLTFHRIIDGFMAQGGDPKGNGTGGSGKTIKGEFSDNGFARNTLSHTRGVVSMARSNHPNSASSQFFICYDAATYLDGAYAAFGKVIEGMETVDEFLETPRNNSDKPVNDIVMQKAEILK